jgi:hypothetical protein
VDIKFDVSICEPLSQEYEHCIVALMLIAIEFVAALSFKLG